MFFERNPDMSKTGTVKFFNSDKGYGFIQPDDGSADSFVHISAVQAAGMQTLDKEQRLSYDVEQGRNGKESAVNLSSAD
jgi:CspA family cold shock protein